MRLHTTCLLALLAPGLLAGCAVPEWLTFPPQSRGSQIDPDALAQLVPGTSTRADVATALGSPSIKAPFDDNTWIYITEVTRPVIGGTQAVLDQSAVTLTFDDKGVLRRIEKKSQDDAKPVAMVEQTTPSPGTEASFMQQLLGNIGRFGPGAPGGGGGGGPNRSGSAGDY